MNCLRNSRSVFSWLMTLRPYCSSTRTLPAPRPSSDVLDSIRGLLFRPAAFSRTPAPPLPASFPDSASDWVRLAFLHAQSSHRARSWYKETVRYTNRTHRVILPPKLEHELGYLLREDKEEHGNDILGPSDPNTARVRHAFERKCSIRAPQGRSRDFRDPGRKEIS
ncbi:hypothetical protein ZWY2020_015441 [Hordeum vulgare]|nr:hypothetical protein ZWY2020_015441 [Hordeum vulgare]